MALLGLAKWRLYSLLQSLRYRSQISHIKGYLTRWGQGKRIWVFAPGLSWRKHLFQRPQQLARALARLDERVIYLEPVGTGHNPPILVPIEPNLILCYAPPQTLSVLDTPLVYLLPWSYSPMFVFHRAQIVYDIVDELSTFKEIHPHLLEFQHHQRLHKASLVLVTAKRLAEAFRDQRPDLILCPNGVDVGFFAHPPGRLALEIEAIRLEGRPVVGYIGALAEWFNDELLEAIAQLRKDISFVVIGPELHMPIQKRPWRDLPNVHWLGARPYESLPSYLYGFDVVMIPFRLSPITHATSPLKLFEAMAAGKPVVLTPMEESLRTTSMIFPGTTPEEWSCQINRALAAAQDRNFVEQIRNFAWEHDWTNRARHILQALKNRA